MSRSSAPPSFAALESPGPEAFRTPLADTLHLAIQAVVSKPEGPPLEG
jgi:hypothetical protein